MTTAPSDLQLLAIGDVHLGTRSSRLADTLSEAGIDPARLSPEAGLTAAVDLAIARKVDAVLFAGDVVESTNARFEALRPLESAVRRLADAGIPVLGVVGNHDVEALPRLARMIDGFELLGEGGQWSARTVAKAGGATVEIVGWSFPERQVRTSPVAELVRNPLPPAAPGVVRIGLMHGDLNASSGTYAPFTASEAQQAGFDAWLLGHIHKPSLREGTVAAGSAPCGYLGSVVGLDPGEPGPHGPWLVRISGAGTIGLEQLVVAPLRWETVDAGVDEDASVQDAGDRLFEVMEREARRIGEAGFAPEVLGLRVRLVGVSRDQASLRSWIDEGAWSGFTRRVGGAGETFVFIDRVYDGLEPAVDLAVLARGSDPLALLARKLVVLEQPSDARQQLLGVARERLRPVAQDSNWGPVQDIRDASDPLSDDALVAMLLQSGRTALNELLAQKGAEGDGPSEPAS